MGLPVLLGAVLLVVVFSLLVVASSALAESYEEAVEGTSGVSHFWPMGESSGSSFADAVGGATAEASGGVTLGEPGGLVDDSSTAALFDGSSGAAQAPVDLSGSGELTVEFWMKWKVFGDDDALALEFTPNFNEHAGGFLVDPSASDGGGTFGVGVGDGASRNNVFFAQPSAEQWHYYAFVIDTEGSGATEITPYVDGHVVSYTKSASGTGGGFADSTLYWMSRDASSLFGTGSMQDLALYDGALSSGRILEHYEIGAGGPKASFSPAPMDATVGVPVRLSASASSSPSAITDYAWDFDGSKTYLSDTGSSATITHTFSSAGTYTVDLRVKDGIGKTATISHTITVGAALDQYEQAVESTSGVSHFWPMGEASGSSLADVFGGADATTSGGVTLGEPGGLVEDTSKSALFDGSSGAAQAPVDLSGSGELTVEFWMKWKVFGDDDALALEFTPNFNEHAGGFLVDPSASDGGGTFGVGVGDGASRNNVFFAQPSAEQWHYYAFVIDTEGSGATEITPYVDGHVVSYTKSASGTGGGFADSMLYWMSRDASSLFGAGSMQDLALYDEALSSGTILEHYDRGENTYDIVNTTAPSIAGTAESEKTLTVNPGSWSGYEPISYAYQWQRCSSAGAGCVNLWGATGSTYGLGNSDVGSRLRVVVTASNSGSSTIATSAATGVVSANTPVYYYSSQFGSEGTGPGQFEGLADIAVGPHGDLWVLDYYNDRVERFSAAGEYLGEFGSSGSGLGELYYPAGITIDSHGNVWVADTRNNRIEEFNEEGEYEKTVGSLGSGDGQLHEPEGVAVDAHGNLWVSDTVNGRLEVFNEKGEFLKTVGSRGYEPGQFEEPQGIAIDSHDHVWVVDSMIDRVAEFNEEGEYIRQFGSYGWENGRFEKPYGITVDAEGDVWVGDTGNNRIEGFNKDGEYISQFGSHGSGEGQFNFRSGMGLAANSSGAIWVTDVRNYRIERWTRATVPVNSAAPSLTGEAVAGTTLRASTGSWAGTPLPNYDYQWQACNSSGKECANITGATNRYYTLVNGDIGATVRVVVSASNVQGSANAPSSPTAVITAATGLANTTLPTISGAARDGQTLTASAGVWTGTAPTYSYQWQSCDSEGGACNDIEGATSQTYTPSSGDLETRLRVVVTATNAAGSAQAASAVSSEVEPGPPSELGAPSISGNPNEGETLYADAGTWAGTEVETGYQWERCNWRGGECVDIVGATEADYKLTESDLFKALRVRVAASNALGSVTAVSAITPEVSRATSTLTNTVIPSISGIPQSGQTLTANAGSWLGLAPIGYGYEWERCDSYGAECENFGPTSLSYTPTTKDVGDTLRVHIAANEGLTRASGTSATTLPIAAEGAPVSEALPAITGTGLVGDTLTATTGAWAEDGPLTYAYQWVRCNESGESCSAISGATASTYTLTESDATHAVRALVTATDTEADSTQVASTPIIASPTTLANVVAPSITGADEMDRPLTADRGIWTAGGSLSYTYQWKRCNEHGESCSSISEATESSYTPGSADVGHELEVVVTATGTAGAESATSTATPVIISSSIAPENIIAPSIEGNLTPGETLTAQTGMWLSSETITYTYQWQKCDEEGEECANISGATGSTYKLIEGDVGATLRVEVTGKNTLGTASAESETTEVVGAAGPPADTSTPTISGRAKQGEHLVAGNGTWSGSRPLSYYYRWERCNSAGESCTSIEGATKPDYTVVSGDVGSTLRVKVTAKNSLSSAGAISVQTSVVVGSEVSATSAVELAEKTDPSVLQPATTAILEEQEVKPALSDSGEQLTTTTSLASSTVSKETPGEFAVNTPAGELSFQPVNSPPDATTLPTIVNGAAAVYAGTSNATDTIVRPDALGATTLLQLRSAEAPTSYSWEVGIGPNQHLEKLSNGDIAVVELLSSSPLEGELGEELTLESSEAAEEHEGAGESSEAAESTLEEEISGESTLEKLAAAPTASTPSVEPKSGELHPQETKTQYETAISTMVYSEEHASAITLMVIEPPKVMDAKGNTVSSSLGFEDETVTVTISPSGGTTFPVTAETDVAAMSDTASKAKGSSVRYGLSDPHSSTFSSFDSHLKSGPLHAKIARDVVSYKTSPSTLKGWLEAVEKAGLEPYITLNGTCEVRHPCETPKIETYAKYAQRLIGGVLKLHKEHPSTIPLVTLWGAWNEPDLGYGQSHVKRYNPLNQRPGSAALIWKKARAILKQVGCKRCTMVAGEFAQDNSYIKKYEAIFRHGNHTYWPTKPHVWGFHDYKDLENYYHHPYNSYAEAFLKDVRRLGKSRIWFSEQGVELQNNKEPTQLEDGSKSEDAKRQRIAANDFLSLANVHLAHELDSVEVVDYYLYKGPSKTEKEEKGEHLFDSALLPGAGVTEEEKHPAPNPRMAYCVLALGKKQGCPVKTTTKAAVPGTVTQDASTVSLSVDPQGVATTYFIEYGLTEAYGKTTTITTLPNEDGEQSETVPLSGLAPCTTYHYQAEAENEANEGSASLGGDETFTTGGCSASATSISAGFSNVCALVSGAGIECWGENQSGQLGDGTFTGPERCVGRACSRVPVPVSNIDGVVAVSAGAWQSCALLLGGSVDCWGEEPYENYSTPVSISGITNATAISVGRAACALLSGGGVDCWGYGGLGDGTTGASATPVAVSGITNAVAISTGFFYACAILAGGEVKCWGDNEHGQLGDGTTVERSTPVTVSGITNAISISAGLNHTCAVLASGHVDCWGSNELGELGDGTETNSDVPVEVSGVTGATEVAAGGDVTCALLSSGSVDCWGANGSGELGNGEYGGPHTAVPVSDITDATSVVATFESACALLSTGGTDCWGYGGEGELGDGMEEEGDLPLPVVGIG